MRAILVSNRLPVTIQEQSGKLIFNRTVGGLATGLKSYLDHLDKSLETLWVGWPGLNAPESRKEEITAKLRSGFGSHPVFLSEEEMENFYHGFCNKTIWALFHYFPSFAVYKPQYWQHYKKVNEIFCRELVKLLTPGDIVWVHDYHLMLLPNLLRKAAPETKIGYFLHIPFPNNEVYRLLPSKWRSELLKGVLGADLIGFHTYDYVQHFTRCVSRILGYEENIGQIQLPERRVQIDTFPMGIDYASFQRIASDEDVKSRTRIWVNGFHGAKTILSVDRLDYSKGILHRLLGYEHFLANNPDWIGKVVLLLLVVPSRIGVEHYRLMKNQIDEMVGRINGRFGRIAWSPIVYQYTSYDVPSLVSLYCCSDVALVTPLRDGMNLIAKEYIACRRDQTGVLVLSEMAGVSKELTEAVIINPNTAEEIASAIKEALEMPKEEQIRRNKTMQTHLSRYDIVAWASDFIRSLNEWNRKPSFQATPLTGESRLKLLDDFRMARSRLVFLDYDGTLAPFSSDPAAVVPGQGLLDSLKSLSELPNTMVVLISGRDRRTLQQWFGHLPLTLVAEHGAGIRLPNQEWNITKTIDSDWKSMIIPVLQRYADRLPGSFVEEKEFSVCYHYRSSDPELAKFRVKQLSHVLKTKYHQANLQLLSGNKVLEIRNAEVNKGKACLFFLKRYPSESVLAIGDDVTDEELFRALPPNACAIKVGSESRQAKYHLPSHREVSTLIHDLSGIDLAVT
jgi:trehalose 6-phosphate synthase/phosphatase